LGIKAIRGFAAATGSTLPGVIFYFKNTGCRNIAGSIAAAQHPSREALGL